MNSNNYHLQELSIASSPADPRRVMPPIQDSYRRILDVGCGAGQTLIASHLAPGVQAIGLDIDRSALILGKEIARRIHFVCGQGESLPFQDGHLDFVFSRVALPYMHLQKALSEMWRVLTQEGKIWLALHPCSITVKEILGSLSRLEVKRVIHGLYVLGNGTVMHFAGKELPLPFGPHRYESFQTIRGITRVLRRVGFEEIETDKKNFFVVTATKKSSSNVVP